MTRKLRNLTRASAVVELVVLLPVLLLIITAMLYVGQLSVYKYRTHFGGQYAMDEAGDQSETGADRGTVSDAFYPDGLGELSVQESDPPPHETPENGELTDLFARMCVSFTSTSVIQRPVLGADGQVQLITTVSTTQSRTPEGEFITRNKLQDDNIPQMTTERLQGWAEHHRVDLSYVYAPDYIKVKLGSWEPLSGSDVSHEFSTRLQSTIRGPARRDVTTPRSGMVDPLTTDTNMKDPSRLSHYPDFRGDQPFWEPN